MQIFCQKSIFYGKLCVDIHQNYLSVDFGTHKNTHTRTQRIQTVKLKKTTSANNNKTK